MRLQTLLFGGPYDHELVVIGDQDGEWPHEIRVGSADMAAAHDLDQIEVAVYGRGEIEEAQFGIFLGAYHFVGMRESFPTLVQVWM